MSDPVPPSTVAEWRAWIDSQLNDAAAAWGVRPGELIGAFHREEAQTKGYRGREVVELLQNADDAGEGCEANEVSISLTASGLVVANTGAVFSPAGVESLMIADNSPKKLSRARFIGNKGLGFRSVLSWTDCPIILSGALEIAFSRHSAERWLAEVCAVHPRLAERVERYAAETAREWPVPVLACPAFLDHLAEQQLLAVYGAPVSETLGRAREVRSRVPSTVIALPFTRPEAHATALEQLKHIGRDALLFTRHLHRLSISVGGVSRERWTVLRETGQIMLSDERNNVSLWQTRGDEGEVPPEFWSDPSYSAPPTWEAKLATPTDASELRGFLYCFFPTQVRFPFPVVAHATLELTQNRQNLVVTPENRYVAARLADLLASLAESSARRSDPWSALRIISPGDGGQVDATLIDLGFATRLDAALTERSVVPTRGGPFRRPGDARVTEGNWDGWLPARGFDELVPWTDDPALRKALARLKVPSLGVAELRRRLELVAPELDPAARARVVAGWLAGKWPDSVVPSVMVDSAGLPLGPKETSFLPPTGGSFPLPKWMDVRFLSDELVSELRRALAIEGVRDLRLKLAPWDVREYALEPIASHITRRLRERLVALPGAANQSRQEVLAAIYAIYMASTDRRSTAAPSDLSVELPTVAGTWKPANQLYFSGDVPEGQLVAALYRSRPELLAAPTSLIAPGEPAESVAGFLRWLGVARLPRSVKVQPEPGYRDYLARRLRYPVDIGDAYWRIAAPGELSSYGLYGCASVEALDSILSGAEPEAILAWVSEDPRWDQWVKDGDPQAEFWPPRAQKARFVTTQHLPAYAVWKLQQTAWMPVHQAGPRPPARCLQGIAVAPELRKVVPVPSIRRDHPNLDLGMNPAPRLRELLRRVGVAFLLSDLEVDDCLDLVQELPLVDPTGATARALYREVIARADEKLPSEGARSVYMARAKLRGRLGDAGGWYRVGELLYDDQGALPAALRRQVPLLDLDAKLAVRNVRDILGVQSVDAQRVEVTVTEYEPAPRAEEVAAYVLGLRPLFLCLANSVATRTRAAAALRTFSLVLCRSASGSARVSEKEYPFNLREPGERIAAGPVVYLVAEAGESSVVFDDPVFADRVAQSVAAALRNNAATPDVARLLTCRKERQTDLLAQIQGWSRERADAELKECANILDVDLDDLELAPKVPPPPPPSPPVPPTPPQPPAPAPPAPPPHVEAGGPPDAVVVTPVPLPPATPPKSIKFRVRSTTGPGAGGRGGGTVADGKLCEEIAMRFEVAEGRFPLLVAQTQGREAVGCDIVSFRTAAERDAFAADTSQHATVVRFVEVKGRSSGTGVIDLRGNELQRARTFGSRYWLYRVYDMGDDTYDFVVLPHPTAGSTREVLEIDLFRSTAAKGYLVEAVDEGGPAPSGAQRQPPLQGGDEPPVVAET